MGVTPNLPAVVVTFLFTDIEGSTQLWERHPQAMQAALARHDELLRRAIESRNGRVIKTTGDGLLAAFGSPYDGIEAVLAGQRALQAETWSDTGPIRARMALHTGEAQARKGDYFGPALNRAARLMSVGAGGQVLISQATASLIRDGLPDGVTLRDLGEHRLKDLVRPEHIYQIVAADLPAEFPPLKSLDAFQNNLPIQLTSFVGREGEIAEAKRLLDETRLLTLTGSGGTGKTRLELQVAAEVLQAFADGTWLVELAPLANPNLIPSVIASMFNLREQSGQTPLALVTDYLRAKQLLLILDNCEHLIGACAQLAEDLLRGCPHLKILASSREALGVAGETVLHVPSLSLPEERPASLDALSRSESVQLFVERARAAHPRFGLTEHNAPAVVQICRRLDGIPLALELAAARLHLFTPEQIAARLDDRFRLLTGGSRTALPRQQTLRALIDWSYDLLPEVERTLLRQLSVFAGGWTFEASEEVCAGEDVLELLGHLVDKSLVVVEQDGEQARYRLLETVRQYAREKLIESGEEATVRRHHLDYFLRFAESAQPHLRGPDSIAWLDRLDAEHDNHRAALEWALENDPVAALRLAALFTHAPQRSNSTEAFGWLTAALARADAQAPSGGEPERDYQAARAKALAALASEYFGRGDRLAARATVDQAIELARRLDDSRTLAFALSFRAVVTGPMGEPEIARASAEEAIAISRDKRYAFDMGLALASLIIGALYGRADFAEARRLLMEMAQSARETGNPWLTTMLQLNRARLAALSGDLTEARARFQEAAVGFRQMRDRFFATLCMTELGDALRWHGQTAEALAAYRISLAEWQKLGRRAAVARDLECFAFIAGAQGQTRRAAVLLGAAEVLRESGGSAMTAMERQEYDKAVARLRMQAGETDLNAAWLEGRRLSMEEAVACALESDPSK